jgi:predicted permease
VALSNDLRVAARGLGRRPGWTLTAAATLALGLGGALAVGSVAYGVLLRPLPYPQQDRLVRVYEVAPRGGRMNVADPNFQDLAGLDTVFAATAQYAASLTAVEPPAGPQRRMVATVSASLFDLLGVRPVDGRLFAPDELRPGGPAVALLSERLWHEWRPASGRLADLELRVGGAPYAVVGVVPAAFDFPHHAEVWVPREQDAPLPSRTAHNLSALARLRDGVALDAARSAADALAGRLIAEHGDRVDLAGFAVVPLLETQVAGARPALLLVLGAAAFLFLVALVNVASLLLSRFRAQQAEIATRVALGADDRRLATHFLGEWLLVALPAALAGVALAAAAIGGVRRLAGASLPRLESIALDLPVALAAVVALVAITVGFVAASTRRARRLDLELSLREGSTRNIGGARGWLRALPLAVQAAATFLLLAAVALVGSSLLRFVRVEAGFHITGIDVLDLYPPATDGEIAIARRAREYGELVERLGALPGSREVGLISTLPLAGGYANGTFLELGANEPPRDFEGFEALARSGARTGEAVYLVASEGYFRALGIALREGRHFEPRDTLEAPHVAVVSESLARAVWPGESALGRRLEFGNMDGDLRALEVVGVVADVRHAGLAEVPPAIVYTNFRQRPQGAWSMAAVVARDQGGRESTSALREVVRGSLPGTPWRLRRIEDVVADSLSERRLLLVLLATFATAALGLAAAGIFGAVSLAVAERRREYAVRLALGAEERGIVRLALRQGLAPTLAGMAGGALAALVGGRVLAGLLFDIRPSHPPALLATAAALVAVAAAAAWLPARGAGRISPASALRAE